MAGGSGTRFWPLSRAALPKQFLSIFGERSLLQQAFERIEPLVGTRGILVVTNQLQVAKTSEQLPMLEDGQVIGEPCGRDTAACIGLAAALLCQESPDVRMIVLAADHLIPTIDEFHRAVRTADAFVQERPGALVTFGIPPTRPATGYGYLRRGPMATSAADQAIPVYSLQSFHEKPDRAKAEAFVASGEYYWNSGIFLWRAQTILAEIERCAPSLRQAIDRIVAAWKTPRRQEVFTAEYERLTKISIDYAVMEKAREVFMVPAPFQWDDVGSWLALDRVLSRTDGENIIIGRHQGIKTQNCIVVGTPNHLVTTLGVKDLIVVQTPDVTLVADRREEQSVKDLLGRLAAMGLGEYL